MLKPCTRQSYHHGHGIMGTVSPSSVCKLRFLGNRCRPNFMGIKLPIHQISKQFLVRLLDYVSRAHEIKICPSSVLQFTSEQSEANSNEQISFTLCFLFPLGHTLRHFGKKICNYLQLLFIFITMAPIWEQNLKKKLLLQMRAKSFQTSPEFCG